jgi:hypothetical protein
MLSDAFTAAQRAHSVAARSREALKNIKKIRKKKHAGATAARAPDALRAAQRARGVAARGRAARWPHNARQVRRGAPAGP